MLYYLGIQFAIVVAKTRVICTFGKFRRLGMKRLLVLILVLTLLVATGTLVSADVDGQTIIEKSMISDSRQTESNITEAK